MKVGIRIASKERESSVAPSVNLGALDAASRVITARNSKPVEENTALKLLALLRANSKVLAICTILGCIGAYVFTVNQTPVYRAQGSLEIQDLNENFLNLREVSQVSSSQPTSSGSDMQTQVRLLQSQSLLARVIGQLPEEKMPPPAGIRSLLPQFSQNEKALKPSAEARAEAASANLQVHDTRQTRIVDLIFDSPDPNYAAAFVNKLAQQYIAQSIEARLEISKGTSSWLEEQIGELRGKLADSENRLQSYAKNSGLLVTTEEHRPDEQKLRQVQENLSKAQENRMMKQARMEAALLAPLDSLEAPLGSALRDHQAKAADLRRQRADLLTVYTPDFDGVKRLESQLVVIEATLRSESAAVLQAIRNDYNDSIRREQLMQEGYESQVAQVNKQGSIAIQYGILKRDVDTNRLLYNTLMQKAAEAKVVSALRASSARLVDRARTPLRPYRPSLALNIMWGSTAGLLLGLVLVTALDRSDDRIRRPGDLAFHLDVPELGVIPQFRKQRPNRIDKAAIYADAPLRDGWENLALLSGKLPSWNNPSSMEAESYRSVLTSILFSREAGRAPQVIVVTSALAAEGKTTLVMNLAAVLSQMKRRVLLIDAARERGLHKMLRLDGNFGLSDLVDLPGVQTDLFQYVTHPTPMPGVSLVATGPKETGALELMYSMTPLLAEMRGGYDVILIDSPSLCDLPDARVFGRMSDGVILVVRAGETTREVAQAAASRLKEDGSILLGTVLNN